MMDGLFIEKLFPVDVTDVVVGLTEPGVDFDGLLGPVETFLGISLFAMEDSHIIVGI
jgi:hypothetical protein